MTILKTIKDLEGEIINHDTAAALAGLTRGGLDYWVLVKKEGPASLPIGGARLYLRSEVLTWKKQTLDKMKPGLLKRRKHPS